MDINNEVKIFGSGFGFGRICMLSFGFGAVTSVPFWFRPKLKKTVSVDLYFPGHVPFTNVGCMRPKKCINKISYQCISITVKKRKCNTCGYIIVL